MKKIIDILLCVCLVLAFSGCKGGVGTGKNPSSNDERGGVTEDHYDDWLNGLGD